MRASEKQRQLRRRKIQAIASKQTCQHLRRTAIAPESSLRPGQVKCLDCGIIITSTAQGIFGEPLTPIKRKKQMKKAMSG